MSKNYFRSITMIVSFMAAIIVFASNVLANPESIAADLQPDHKNYEAIKYLMGKGVLQGYSDGTMRPEQTVNRAEQLKILIEGQGIAPDSEKYQNCFPDVKDEWFAKYVCYAKDQGWVQGYPDGTFKPAQTVNKVEAIKMLIETHGLTNELPANVESELDEGEMLYEDVGSNTWYAPYIALAKKKALLEEVELKLDPAVGMSRAGISENLYRLLKIEEDGLDAFPNIEYVYVPKPAEPTEISFDGCNSIENYASHSWYSQFENEASSQKLDIDDIKEACYSETGNMLIMIVPGGYMQSGEIYRFDTQVLDLEKARRIHKGVSYTASPKEFGKREGDVIKLEGRDGDGGCEWKQYYDYHFNENAIELMTGYSRCEGGEETWHDYENDPEWKMYSEKNWYFDISFPETLQLTCPAYPSCYFGSLDLNPEQYYTTETIPEGAMVMQIGSYRAEDDDPVTNLQEWRESWEGGLDPDAKYQNIDENGKIMLEEEYTNKKTMYVATGTGRVLAFTLFPLNTDNSALFSKILKTLELTYFTHVAKKTEREESPDMKM